MQPTQQPTQSVSSSDRSKTYQKPELKHQGLWSTTTLVITIPIEP